MTLKQTVGRADEATSTEEQSASVQEMTAGAQELAGLATTLQGLVARFVLEDEPASAGLSAPSATMRAA